MARNTLESAVLWESQGGDPGALDGLEPLAPVLAIDSDRVAQTAFDELGYGVGNPVNRLTAREATGVLTAVATIPVAAAWAVLRRVPAPAAAAVPWAWGLTRAACAPVLRHAPLVPRPLRALAEPDPALEALVHLSAAQRRAGEASVGQVAPPAAAAAAEDPGEEDEEVIWLEMPLTREEELRVRVPLGVPARGVTVRDVLFAAQEFYGSQPGAKEVAALEAATARGGLCDSLALVRQHVTDWRDLPLTLEPSWAPERVAEELAALGGEPAEAASENWAQLFTAGHQQLLTDRFTVRCSWSAAKLGRALKAAGRLTMHMQTVWQYWVAAQEAVEAGVALADPRAPGEPQLRRIDLLGDKQLVEGLSLLSSGGGAGSGDGSASAADETVLRLQLCS